MNKSDSLKQFVALHQALLQEKAGLEQRLAQIEQALSGTRPAPSATPRAAAPKESVRRRMNKLSLKAAVVQATTAKPLTKTEILAAVQELGYRFGVPNPLPSLNTVLYTGKVFKNEGGKFSPVRI
jgi:hypothetical protein